MKKTLLKLICLLLCTLFLACLLPTAVYADTGPKPSVKITFENMGDALCYGTLLSEKPSTGPSSVWDGNEETAYHNGNEHFPHALLDYETWKKFVEYEDSDGYYFLQHSVWEVSESGQLHWNYYPPQRFKILLYYPETGKFVASGIYERYAFDSYFTVDMAGVDIGTVIGDGETSGGDDFTADRSYEWGREAVSLVIRILITLAIEMGVALLFGFRKKRALLLLVTVNAVTQILLNVALNVIRFHSGEAAFVLGYVLLELVVFAIEAVFCSVLRRKLADTEKPVWFFVLYALTANAVSFGAGLAIANILPGIF